MNDDTSDKRALRLITIVYWTSCAAFLELRLIVPDGVGYYVYAQSLATRWDLSIVAELQRLGAWDFFTITPLGHARNVFAVGTALLWLPLIAVTQLLSIVARLLGAPASVDGVGAQYLYAIAFGTSVYGYLALCLTYRCTRVVACPRDSLIAVFAIGTITPFFYYAFFGGSCSHVPAAFCVALLLYWRIARRPQAPDDLSYPAMLGFSAGLCALVRPELALLGVVVAVEIGLGALRGTTHNAVAGATGYRRWAPLAVFSATAALTFAPQSVVWWLQFGQLLVVPQGEGFLNVWRPRVLTLLFSSHHGLFSWAPALLLATIGLCVLRDQSAPSLRWLLLALLVPQIYVAAAVADVDAGASFGARRLVPMSPVFAIGLAAGSTRVSRGWASALLLFCGAWTLGLLLAFKWQFLPPAHFAGWDQVAAAVARATAEAPLRVLAWRSEQAQYATRLLQVERGGWLLLGAAASVIATCAFATRSMQRSRPISLRLAARCAVAGAASLVAAIAFAAERSVMAAVPAEIDRGQALLDFSTYANSRSDSNPFRPALKAFSRCPELAGRYLWGDVPFEIAPPAAGHQDKASVITSCENGGKPLTVVLPAVRAQRIHFALVARSPSTGLEAAAIEITLRGGKVKTRSLTTGRDVRDLFDVIPAERSVAHSLFTTVQGFSLTAESEPIRLTLRPGPDPRACLAIFAVTLEGRPGEYEPIDLTPFANANHGVNFFMPESRVNYFPDLAPGRLRVGKESFLLPRPAAGITGGNTLTAAGASKYRQRLPLQPIASYSLAMLIDGRALPAKGIAVARVRVEYTRGDPTVSVIRSGVHLHNYDVRVPGPIAWRGRGSQDLTLHHIRLDERRIPSALWVEAATQSPVEGKMAIFAITQGLVSPASLLAP